MRRFERRWSSISFSVLRSLNEQAIRKAVTTSSALGLANTENAFAAEMAPVSTTAAAAKIVEVKKRQCAIQHGSDRGYEDREKMPCRSGKTSRSWRGPNTDSQGNRKRAPEPQTRLAHDLVVPPALPPPGAEPTRTRPLRPTDSPCTFPSSSSSRNFHENSYVPVAPE